MLENDADISSSGDVEHVAWSRKWSHWIQNSYGATFRGLHVRFQVEDEDAQIGDSCASSSAALLTLRTRLA